MGAPAARTYEHARRWAELGHKVTVVCGLPNHPDGIIPEKYRGHLLHREKVDGINVLRCWLFATPNKGVFKRSISFLTFMFSSIFFAIFYAGKTDIVVATSPQMLCGFAGYFVAKFKRAPFVLEVRDLWPKQIIDLGVVRSSIIIFSLQWLEMFMYRKAKAIVTVAKATTEEIASRGISIEKFYTITNGIDENFYTPRDRDSAPPREQYRWGDKTVVMYIGTHGLSQGLSTILDCAEMLIDRRDIHFVFAGQGADREPLMKQAKAMNLFNVEFLPFQQKITMPGFYAAADICLVPLKKKEVFLYNIPSKMFEIMACKRPIILGVKGQAKRILEETHSGIAVEPDDARAFANAILHLTDNPELAQSYGKQGRRHVIRHYSRNAKADAYIQCLQAVIGLRAEKSAAYEETR